MSSSRSIFAALSAVLVAGAGCGGDKATSPNGATLSDTEYTAMLNAFARIGATSAAGPVRAAGLHGPAATVRQMAAATTSTTNRDTTYTCSGGGTAQIHATLSLTSVDAQSFTGSGTATLLFTACKETASTGEQFTFDGSPNLAEVVSVASTPTSFVTSIHVTGQLRWALSGRSGSCDFDTIINQTNTSTTTATAVSGTICGRPAPQSFTTG